MKKFLVTTFGLLLAISAASPNYGAEFKFDNGGGTNAFLTATNWDPDGVPDNTLGNQYGINDGFVVTYGLGAEAGVSTSVRSLIVGGDVPQTPGDFGTPGRLNMSDGVLKVTGGGDSFQIGRACCNDLASDVSVMDLSGDAVLEINGSDPIVGTRDAGQLLVRGTASVVSIRAGDDTTVYWRLGNYGPSFDPGIGGLQGDGLLDVSDNGSFKAHVIFIGDNDATGKLRVSDNGSVILTGNLLARPSGAVQAAGSATVEMIGSNATLNAYNLESESLAGEIRTKYLFEKTDAIGVSEIKLIDAVNITNNDLTVDLNGFDLPAGGTHLLFDGAPNRIFGTFANLTVLDGNPAYTYALVYRNFHHGDILIRRVPEPSTMLLLGLGMVMVISAKRRASR